MSRFVAARSLNDALEVMARGEARALAGGTDLMPRLRRARLAGEPLPNVIVDVSRLSELTRLDLGSERPYIGAGISFRRLESDLEVERTYPILKQAAATVGSVQVRQTASIGGNVANASPAADGVTALVALGARAEVVSIRERRFCRVEELITGPGQTILANDELILGFELDRLKSRDGQVFSKVGRRRGVSVARLNVAVCLDPAFSDCRVVLGACFPSPRRLNDVEELLANGVAGDALWREAGRKATDLFQDVCGWRSSAAYKVQAIARVTGRTLALAWERVARGA
ncbi:MAG: FAD binding domain-containing protein [Deltaproteobacteria bacterium]|nr:FAD binding domain-containing protein [Deltaproteobacteria bacterium]